MSFRSAEAACVSRIQNFRSGVFGSSVQTIIRAILGELRRAKPPNGQTLRALITAGGIYSSPTRGLFDLVETFFASIRVAGQELPSAFSNLVDAVVSDLRAVRGLPRDLCAFMELQMQRARRQINAVATHGGDIHRLLIQALRWPTGKGAADGANRDEEASAILGGS